MDIVLPLGLGNAEAGQYPGEHLCILQRPTCAGIAVGKRLLDWNRMTQEIYYLRSGLWIANVVDEKKFFRPVMEIA